MSYAFRMVFHGIMAIVKDRDCYHVIVPDTRRGSWDENDLKEEKALDNTRLLRHVPMLDNKRLDGVRIRVEGLPNAPFEPDLQSLPRMKAVVGPDWMGLDPYYWRALRQTGSNPPPNDNLPPAVLACLTIDRGRLFAGTGCAALLSALEGVADAQPTSGLIATTVTWQVEGVDGKLEVYTSPLSGSGQSKWRSYGPPQGGKSHITLKFSNHCREPGHSSKQHGHSQDDPDFKWYYNMLHRRQEVKNHLQNGKRVLPYPVATAVCPEIRLLDHPGIEGVNCRPCLFD